VKQGFKEVAKVLQYYYQYLLGKASSPTIAIQKKVMNILCL